MTPLNDEIDIHFSVRFRNGIQRLLVKVAWRYEAIKKGLCKLC